MEANSKPLYQPWNEEEFQADVFVRGMTWLQRHLYRALLQASFFHSTRPYLPNDDDVLWVLAGAESPEMWEQNKTKILKRFHIVAEQPNLLENSRVTADWNRLIEAREKKSEMGQKSASVRRALTGTAQPQKSGFLNANAEPSSNVGSETVRANVERSFGPRHTDLEQSAEQEKLSEVKRSEEKESEEISSATKVVSSMPSWKNLSLRYRNAFGKKAGAEFQKKYFDACNKYGEDIVLECFDVWATASTKEWCEVNNFDKPLHLFFKKLPAEAEDAVAEKEALTEQAEQQAAAKKERADKQAVAEKKIADSIEQQTAEIVARRDATHGPQVNEASIDELL